MAIFGFLKFCDMVKEANSTLQSLFVEVDHMLTCRSNSHLVSFVQQDACDEMEQNPLPRKIED